MAELARKKRYSGKRNAPALIGRSKTARKKQLPSMRDRRRDSEDIERAVYDGMQDLRLEKSG